MFIVVLTVQLQYYDHPENMQICNNLIHILHCNTFNKLYIYLAIIQNWNSSKKNKFL